MGTLTGEADIVEAFFNELSFPVRQGTPYSALRKGFISSLKYLRSHGAVTKVRTDRTSYKSLLDIAETDWNARTYIYSMLVTPFENEDDTDDEYLMHTWTCEEKECQGLSYACIKDTVAVSLDEEPWRRAIVDIHKDDECVSVYNVYRGQDRELDDFFESMTPVVLIETELKPEEKKRYISGKITE